MNVSWYHFSGYSFCTHTQTHTFRHFQTGILPNFLHVLSITEKKQQRYYMFTEDLTLTDSLGLLLDFTLHPLL